MANISGSYDTNAEPSADFSPVPNNNYRAKIIESDVEPISKDNDFGRCLKLTWQIETGAYDGRLVWQRINLWPQNFKSKKPEKSDAQVLQESINIANAEFASIRQATGKLAPQDSSDLHHIPCNIYVGLSKPRPGFNQQNEVKSVKAIAATPGGQASPPAGQQRQAPQQQNAASQRTAPASNAGGSTPWRKSA